LFAVPLLAPKARGLRGCTTILLLKTLPFVYALFRGVRRKL